MTRSLLIPVWHFAQTHIMEQRMHADIASLGFGFHLSKSKWNQTRSVNSSVFRIREQEVEVSYK